MCSTVDLLYDNVIKYGNIFLLINIGGSLY